MSKKKILTEEELEKYPAFRVIFDTAEDIRQKLPKEVKVKYDKAVYDCYTSGALANECEGIIQVLANELIYKVPSLEALAVYRLALKYGELFRARLESIALEYENTLSRQDKEKLKIDTDVFEQIG